MPGAKGPVIVVSGPPGSGKTTYAKHIADKLKMNLVSAGGIFREIARERGVSVIELSEIAAKDPSIDLMVDKRMLEKAKEGNVVLEGHLTAWIVSEYADLKIYLAAPFVERVKRIALREGKSFSEALIETSRREFLEATRFRRYYGIDILDLSIFDYVIDTSKHDIEGIKRIIDFVIKQHFRV